MTKKELIYKLRYAKDDDVVGIIVLDKDENEIYCDDLQVSVGDDSILIIDNATEDIIMFDIKED